MSHYQLAVCWLVKGRLDEATAGFRHSIELDPRGEMGHESLAETLLRSGRFTEARTALRQGLDVVPTEEPRVPILREKQELCERMIALDARLPAILQGRERPAAAEQVELARLCRKYGRPHAAAGLYAAAFAAQPALADDLYAGHRYAAACAAARAAADLGPDGARLNERDRASLRRQALGWLRADLALGAKLRRDGKLADLPLADWQTENDLAGVRAPASLAELPAAEREEWRHLWADVGDVAGRRPAEAGPSVRRPPRLGPSRRLLHESHQGWRPRRRSLLVRVRRPDAALRRPRRTTPGPAPA